jgi:hypothetical protein
LKGDEGRLILPTGPVDSECPSAQPSRSREYGDIDSTAWFDLEIETLAAGEGDLAQEQSHN